MVGGSEQILAGLNNRLGRKWTRGPVEVRREEASGEALIEYSASLRVQIQNSNVRQGRRRKVEKEGFWTIMVDHPRPS